MAGVVDDHLGGRLDQVEIGDVDDIAGHLGRAAGEVAQGRVERVLVDVPEDDGGGALGDGALGEQPPIPMAAPVTRTDLPWTDFTMTP